MTELYQKDHLDRIRLWRIELDLEKGDECPQIVVHAGLKDGALIETRTEIVSGMNIGRSNQTTPVTQALFDIQTEINKKLKAGYVAEIENIKEKSQTATIDKPAKGLRYSPTPKKDHITLDDCKLRGQKVGIQRKLDGWRYRIWSDGIDVIYYTSSGDVTMGFPQITMALIEPIQQFLRENGLDSITLDGEIYNHELGFQAVASACGTTKKITPTKQALRDKMQFHIFDIVGNWGNYKDRYHHISRFADEEFVVLVSTMFITANDGDLQMVFEEFLEEGYEGLIIRRLDTPYQHRKNKQFLKYKPICDEEFKIVGFNKSITGETLGSFRCEMGDGTQFDCDTKDDLGTDAFKRDVWMFKEDYIGRYVTVEFLEYTDDRIPRHPRAKSIRPKQDIS